jgi:sulfate adenylyltransferase subunit 2
MFNTRLAPGQSMRVFPLSDWTEIDIWDYIRAEGVPLVPLYFAKIRPTVTRKGQILVVDDGRMQFLPGETVTEKLVRFRTLGCYPLTAAIESPAATVEEILHETLTATSSERQGRLIDADDAASMEKKKRQGYF